MKILKLLLPAVLLVFFAGSSTVASEWHGIVPLHSTRADVLRILGEPNSKYDRYLIDGEEADILYTRGPCWSGWNVPTDTVMLISVTFKQSPKLSDLKIDFDKYGRTRDPLVTSHVYYTNREEGIQYEVFEGLNKKKCYKSITSQQVKMKCSFAVRRNLRSKCLITSALATVRCSQVLLSPPGRWTFLAC